MSSDPTDTPDVPTTAPAPVADYVAANRGPVAVALIAVGIVCLAVGGYYLAKGFNARSPRRRPTTRTRRRTSRDRRPEPAGPHRRRHPRR